MYFSLFTLSFRRFRKPASLLILCALLTGGLSACGLAHKVDINQGNLLHLESLEQLEVGMTKEQVRFLIGEPILADPFHKQRWDYIYLAQPGRREPVRRLLRLHFDKDLLVKIEGDLMPPQKS